MTSYRNIFFISLFKEEEKKKNVAFSRTDNYKLGRCLFRWEVKTLSKAGEGAWVAALSGCGFNRPNIKFRGKPWTVLTQVRLLPESQFDFIVFLFVSIVCPALSRRVPRQWTLSVSLSS